MSKQMTDQQKVDCLAYEPFNDRDMDVRVFRDRIVRARNAHKCQHCAGPIKPGEEARARTELYDGQVATFRFCFACCLAQAAVWQDDGEAIQARILLHDPDRPEVFDAIAKAEGQS